MDMKEASEMIEASGLVDDHDGSEPTAGAQRRPLRSPSQDFAPRWAERLREVTAKAPLQSLFVAFRSPIRPGGRARKSL